MDLYILNGFIKKVTLRNNVIAGVFCFAGSETQVYKQFAYQFPPTVLLYVAITVLAVNRAYRNIPLYIYTELPGTLN